MCEQSAAGDVRVRSRPNRCIQQEQQQQYPKPIQMPLASPQYKYMRQQQKETKIMNDTEEMKKKVRQTINNCKQIEYIRC